MRKFLSVVFLVILLISIFYVYSTVYVRAAPTDIPTYGFQIPLNTSTFKYLIVNGYAFNIGPDDKLYASDFNNYFVNVVDSSGNYIRTLDHSFQNPNGIAIDSSNNVYVADQSNDRIVKFDSTGAFVSTWGTSGSGNGQFSVPTSLSIDNTGNYIYVVDTGNSRVQKFDLSGNYQLKFGSYGPGDGSFSDPRAVAVDASGKVYIADSGNDRVQVFTSLGVFSTKFGSTGSGDGQMDYPAGLAIDSSGNIWVSEGINNRIQEFTSAYAFIQKWGEGGQAVGQIERPSEIHFDSAGHLWVQSISERITEFQTDGTFMQIYTTLGGNPTGSLSFPKDVVADSLGNIYVADYGNNRVSKYDFSGNLITTWVPVKANPWIQGIAIDSNSNIYMIDYANSQIEKTDSSGNHLLTFGNSGPGTLSSPYGAFVDASDKLYVVDQGNNRIVEFDINGNYVGTFGDGTHLNSPSNVIKDSSGNFWIADSGNDDIVEYDSGGNFVTAFGTTGTGNGQLDYPQDIDIDSSGYLYVVDYLNNRVQKFDTGGNYLASWGPSSGTWGGDAPGQLSSPFGIYIDRYDKFYITDGNHRVQMFTFPGYATPGPATPTPTPTSAPPPVNPPPQSCNDPAPPYAPDLFAITRTSTSAILFFSPVNFSTTAYDIFYGVTPSDSQYSTSFTQGFSPGALSYTVNSLNPNDSYTFKVRALNNCVAGPFSLDFTAGAPVVTPSTTPHPSGTPTPTATSKAKPSSTPLPTFSPTPSTIPNAVPIDITIVNTSGDPVTEASVNIVSTTPGSVSLPPTSGTTNGEGSVVLPLPPGNYVAEVTSGDKYGEGAFSVTPGETKVTVVIGGFEITTTFFIAPPITPEQADTITKTTAKAGGTGIATIFTINFLSIITVVSKSLLNVYKTSSRSALNYPLDLIASSGQWVIGLVTEFIGFRKKSKASVFNSVNSGAVGGAYLVFYSSTGNLKTAFTDKYGHYNAYPLPDKYKLRVQKANYEFPSKVVTVNRNESYDHIYVYDEVVEVMRKGDAVSDIAVPIDPAKNKKGVNFLLAKINGTVDFIFNKLGIFIAITGMAISGYAAVNHQPLLNAIVFEILLLYVFAKIISKLQSIFIYS